MFCTGAAKVTRRGAPEGMAKPAGAGSSRRVRMTDFTQQEAAAVIGNLLVVVSVSYLYPIYTNSYHV